MGTEKRENQRVMLSKRLIKDSLTRLLATESIHKVSIRSLCEDAGINRSTFYKYYGSQYDVLAEMEADLIGSISNLLNENSATIPDKKTLEAICSYFERNMDFVQRLIGNNVDPGFPERLFNLPQIRQILMDRLSVHYDGERLGYVYVFLINGCYRLVQEWLAQEERMTFKEAAFLMWELIDKVCA